MSITTTPDTRQYFARTDSNGKTRHISVHYHANSDLTVKDGGNETTFKRSAMTETPFGLFAAYSLKNGNRCSVTILPDTSVIWQDKVFNIDSKPSTAKRVIGFCKSLLG